MNKPLAIVLFFFVFVTTLTAGPLEPDGPPAPTHKTLTQIEPRTALASNSGQTQLLIDQSGTYYLTEDIAVVGDHGIVITADDVELDLNGFTVSGSGSLDFFYGIYLQDTANVSIRNGTVTGFNTNGIRCDTGSRMTRLTSITVRDNDSSGIACSNARGLIADDLMVTTNGGTGISCDACLIKSSVISNNSGTGVRLRHGSMLVGSIVNRNSPAGTDHGVFCFGGGLIVDSAVTANGSDFLHNIDASCTQPAGHNLAP